jgi:hypothetical protein
MGLKNRKGRASLGSSGGGKLKKLLEGSTIVDLLTIGVLVYDFFLLRQNAGGYGGAANIFQVSGDPMIIAAQLTGLVVAIYIIEAIIDSAGS